ncbi:MAG TPA: DsrE family protein [Fimbriimonadaceae bacterium]|jgi:hypothetical protein
MKTSLLLSILAFSGIQTAKHKVVIEVNVAGLLAYSTILNNAENLEKAFGSENLQLEVVCHGNGLGMLIPSSAKLVSRIKALQRAGAVFAACGNTMKGMHVSLKQLVPGAITVDSGVAEVVRKEESGWAYLKGG